jgi:RimJ/RimL family protein N-acetyltransferase
MHIRTLTIEDTDAYWSLRLRALRDHPAAYWSSYEEESLKSLDEVQESVRKLNPPQTFILGAWVDGQLVGITGFWQQEKRKVSHKGFIWGVYVAPEQRGKGIAKALMLQTLDLAAQNQDLEQVNLVVMATNVSAYRLYVTLGFEEFGRETRSLKVNGVYYDELHMVKFLHT